MNIILIFLLIFLVLFIVRPFIVFFTKLGQAIPAILLTKKPVTIFIGSYNDTTNSFYIKIGLLHMYIKYNPFTWWLGFCLPAAKEISNTNQFIYIICGPIINLIIALCTAYFAFVFNFHGLFKLILLLFFCSSFIDLVFNLMPRTKLITLSDGSLFYTDGYHLKKLYDYKKFAMQYDEAIKFHNHENYEEAFSKFNDIISKGYKDSNVYRHAISCALLTKKKNEAEDIMEDFLAFGNLDSNDFANVGLFYSKMKQQEKALPFYDKALAINPDNIYALNNKGFSLLVLCKFDEAILLFNTAIEIENLFAYSYCNRGLAKLKNGNIKEGLDDINYSLELDENNAYGYRNLGIYHHDIGEKQQALKLFTQAKKIESDVYEIDELIQKAQSPKII